MADGCNLDIGLGSSIPTYPPVPIDKTNHMALYTEKFIAIDYLAGVQTHTNIEKGKKRV